jgi:hypothetical protein
MHTHEDDRDMRREGKETEKDKDDENPGGFRSTGGNKAGSFNSSDLTGSSGHGSCRLLCKQQSYGTIRKGVHTRIKSHAERGRLERTKKPRKMMRVIAMR